MPTRRKFLAGSAVAMGGATTALFAADAGAGGGGRPHRTSVAANVRHRPPNIILILHDDLGWGETGPYGQRVIHTPNIDKLAAEGLRFTTYYGGGCVCAPSRSVALTGLHGGHTTVRQNPERGVSMSFKDSDVTFAEVLRTRGYKTGHFGKWGFGPTVGGQPSHPNERGFEEFFGYLTHGEAHHYYPHRLWHNGDAYPMDGRTYAPPLFAARALDFITQNAADPFLVYLAPNLPHAPSAVPTTAPYDNPRWTGPDRGHAAQVALLDEHVGEVVARVRELNLQDHTYIMVTSDHGPHEEGGVNPDFFGSRGGLRGYKRNLYEGGIRVPFIAWRPGTVPVGTTDAPVGHVDLLPTMAELADTVHPTDVDGLSFAGVLTGAATAAPGRDHFYWYRRDPYNEPRASHTEGGRVTRVAEAIRRDDWKLVRIAPGHRRPATSAGYPIVQLFDLALDPHETKNVAGQHPTVIADLIRRIDGDWADVYHRVPYGVSVQAATTPLPGETTPFTVTFANGTGRPLALATLTLTATDPAIGVRALAAVPATAVPVGTSVSATWHVTLPADATLRQTTDWKLNATAVAAAGDTKLRFAREHSISGKSWGVSRLKPHRGAPAR